MRALHHCALLLAAVILASCHKTKTPVPPTPPAPVTTDIANGAGDDPSVIHGYMYASYTNNSVDGSLGYLSEYCTFRDPSADIMQNYNHYTESESFNGGQNDNSGNINMGQVTFNGQALFINLNNLFISYRTNGSNNASIASLTANWHTDGNGSFKSMDLQVPRGFPKFSSYPSSSGSGYSYTINVSQGFSVNLSHMASNYDSLTIFVGNPNAFNSVHRTVTPNSAIAAFSASELAPFSYYGSVNVSFAAYNYSHKTIEDKLYVFELANKCSTYALIQP